ncbi:MAG: AAA family ATPase [Myxococcales bacterium]|nr:AAA family ATPase [Myxococcales bacterium]
MSGISRLRLVGFRRYEDATFTFEPGTTFLEGENNAGKTSVFYAIEYALFGRARTTLSATELIRPKAKGVGVELCFTGRDGASYRLQRAHLRPPGSRTRLTGHFTLWVTDPGSDSTERYLLSSDFEDQETALQLVLRSALGVTRRGWDLAVHLEQGRVPDILDGDPKLDIVLGVSASVLVEEELRGMALDREKAANELPALEASLAHLATEREARTARLVALSETRDELRRQLSDVEARTSELDQQLAALAPAREAARALEEAERAATSASTEHARAIERRDAQGDAATLGAAVCAAAASVASSEARRAALDDRKKPLRWVIRDAQARQGNVDGRLTRARGLSEVCETCGQRVDPDHVHALVPALEQERATATAALEAALAEEAALESELSVAQAALEEARASAHRAEEAARRHADADAEVERAASELRSAEQSLLAARVTAREQVEAPDDELLSALRARYEAERDRLRETRVRLEADADHARQRVEELEEERGRATDDLRRIDREHAATETKAYALRADAVLAAKLRVLAKGFKQVQQDLREQATAAMAERTLSIHRHLSGDDQELKDVVIDPKRYVVEVTPRDLGRRVPAGQAQGGGHRLLLGLAARLALAERVGPLPFVLLDEPTYGLDARRRASLLERITELGVTEQMLLITHHDVGAAGANVVRVVRDGATSRVEGR